MIIEVDQVAKNFKKTPALLNLSLQIKSGEIFGLIGPDGAGKSTLIHVIAGILRPDKGKVSVLGKNVLKDPESIKTSIGFLPQGLGLALAQELSVEENINYFAEINHVAPKKREERKALLLEKTQLTSFRDRPAKNLSGGMQQKLALCCTLIHGPKLILLDEPTTGVDPISRRDLWEVLNTMVEESGVTVFLTTSYMDEAARCHRVALMNNGEIIDLGVPNELLAKLKDKVFSIEAADGERELIKGLKAIPDVEVAYPMGRKIHAIYKKGDLAAIRKDVKTAGLKVKSVETGSPSIEDLFLAHTTNIKNDAINEQAFLEFFQKQEIPFQSDMPVVIKAEALEKKFKAFIAVNKINFGIKQGEIFGFLGPNGAGKTTTIKMLCGLLQPTSGTGTVAGFNLSKQVSEIKKNIGYMSQRFSLYGNLTVAENIELYGSVYGISRKEVLKRRKLIIQITDLVGKEKTITNDLPLGIKQRLALGCAILHKPDCVFLDEPTSGVDPVARRKFWDTIFLLSRRMGVTILVSTHHLDEAEYCDRIILINQGEIKATGDAEELRGKVRADLGTLLEISTENLSQALKAVKETFSHSFIYGPHLHVYTKYPASDIHKIKNMLLTNNLHLANIQEQVIPFENVFTYFCESAKEPA
jgi:ABC-2 type transport system ATP-binding protein